jgi:hypothetical protein
LGRRHGQKGEIDMKADAAQSEAVKLSTAMTSFDANRLKSPEDRRNELRLRLVVDGAAEDELDCDQEASQTELEMLRSSNHRLRVENLALRTRIEGLKSGRSLERYLMIGATMLLWFFFILFVINKTIALWS